MNIELWYSIKCIFRHLDSGKKSSNSFIYEERIVLIRAESDDEAIVLAEKNAIEYAKETDCEYLNFATSFHLFEENVVSFTEVYSEMRGSNLESNEYLDYFYDTGCECVK